MKHIIIDYQTQEEFEDMKIILINSNINLSHVQNFVTIKNNSNFFNNSKIVRRFYIIFLLYSLLRKQKKKYNRNDIILFTGSPALEHRLVLFLHQYSVKHFIYYRGLLSNPLNISSISDFIRFKICFGLNNKLLNNYLCDLIITIGDFNKNYFIKRDIPDSLIETCGFIQKIVQYEYSNNNDDVFKYDNVIYFLTTAFLEHGHNMAHKDQLEALKKLKAVAESLNTILCIKKHPKDNTDYIKILNYSKLIILDISANSFFKNYKKNTNSFIISTYSTIIFEASEYKIPILVYSTDKINLLFPSYFNKLISSFSIEQICDIIQNNNDQISLINTEEIYSTIKLDFTNYFN